jgi:hypothetical protein
MTYYTYNDISLNLIFSKNDSDATNTTMTDFKENSTSLVYDTANGSVSIQNSINYTATSTNYFSNLSAYYVDYLYNALIPTYTININARCTAISILLCGAGGSGGGGAGDTSSQRGESGSGGGGGAYYYKNHVISTVRTFYLTIGRGGPGVSGSDGGNSGKTGSDGNDTILSTNTANTDIIAKANGGSGGTAGHPDNTVNGGEGANGGIGVLISAGNNGSNSTSLRLNFYASAGGNSGWVIKIAGNATYPKYSSGNYGNGGAGSRGEFNPQIYDSGPGEHGWARIYFLY